MVDDGVGGGGRGGNAGLAGRRMGWRRAGLWAGNASRREPRRAREPRRMGVTPRGRGS
jgi:hypothetical protein